jgi:hypothetical protein
VKNWVLLKIFEMFIYGEKFADSQTQAAEITPKVENVRLIYLKTFF